MIKEIPFNVGHASGLDELAGAGTSINVLVDKSGAIRARPGIKAWSEFPATFPSTTAVLAMAVFGPNLLYVTEDRKVFCWRPSGTVLELSTGSAGTVDGAQTPMIAVSRNYALIAGGGVPQKVDIGLSCTRLGGSPPSLADVVFLTQRAVGSGADLSGIFYWSGPGETGLETWDIPPEYREAETEPDPIVALRKAVRELFAFGTETTEIYAPDEIETFTPISAVAAGCSARRSPVLYEGLFAWLDDRRRFVLSDGRVIGPENVLSVDIARTLESFTTVADCWGYRERIGAHDSLVWTFPTEGRAFCLEMTTRRWSERHGFEDGRWTAYPITSYLWWQEQNLHLVGLSNGQIAALSLDAYTDNGKKLRWVARTGFSDLGEPRAKDPIEAQLRVRRGDATADDSSIELRWRNDLGAFGRPIRFPLGGPGTVDPTVVVRPCGTPYRAREWELSSTAEEACVVTKAYEEFQVLEA